MNDIVVELIDGVHHGLQFQLKVVVAGVVVASVIDMLATVVMFWGPSLCPGKITDLYIEGYSIQIANIYTYTNYEPQQLCHSLYVLVTLMIAHHNFQI